LEYESYLTNDTILDTETYYTTYLDELVSPDEHSLVSLNERSTVTASD
jgi:hypothetical protein